MNYEVEITKLDNYGRGICYINNKITFIKDSLVGEKVKVVLTKEANKYNEGYVLEYISKSKDRICDCPKYKECGGCHLAHMPYSMELEFKEQKVKDILFKYASLEKNIVKKIIPCESLNYRNKAVFKKGIGYYKEKTNELVKIDNCLLVSDRINNVLRELKNIDLRNIDEVLVRTNEVEELVVFKGSKVDIDKLSFKNILLNDKLLKGNNYLIDKIGDYKFYVSANSFFQINRYGVINLYNKIYEYVNKSDNLLDLYCGTGSIGIYLSKICKNIKGVEVNEDAINDAIKNKELNHLENIEFICLDASLFKDDTKYDTIVVDPPRSGLDKNTINYLLESNTDKIIYVSCDVVTLARDLKVLKDKYNVLEVTPVDMFPRTYHVENVCILKKLNKKN